ncbi:hypothetical protein GCM10007922_23520 [Shewanella decolorationis]|nr:hypothetical protein GCM10007922_23520 [Shewanella decolorationis]
MALACTELSAGVQAVRTAGNKAARGSSRYDFMVRESSITIYQHFRDAKITAKFVAINGILWDYESHIMRLKLS